MRKNESFTQHLHKLAFFIGEKLGQNFKTVIITDDIVELPVTPYKIEQIVNPGTKYKKLKHLIESDTSDYFLSIDNDISANEDTIWKFLQEGMGQGVDIAWGQLRAQLQPTLIAKLVGIDKLLSHDFIRPLLWKMGVGISIPGQLFLIKRVFFKNGLAKIDTYLDDLALGVYANLNAARRLVKNTILGFEYPNVSLKGLLNQRKRWAHGYFSILKYAMKIPRLRGLVIIHGMMYHLLWAPLWGAVLILFYYYWPLSIVLILLTSAGISRREPSKIILALFYQFVFPVFHIWWLVCLLSQFLALRQKSRGMMD